MMSRTQSSGYAAHVTCATITKNKLYKKPVTLNQEVGSVGK
jgi:hypothetical protein